MGRPTLQWSADDQYAFCRGLMSEGLVTTSQFDLAAEHMEATGLSIGHWLIHTGAITQRQLLASIERL